MEEEDGDKDAKMPEEKLEAAIQKRISMMRSVQVSTGTVNRVSP